MTSLLNVVRLEVETATPRNQLRNPSGQRGFYGWNKDLPFAVTVDRIALLTGSASPVAEDGFAFSFAPGGTIQALRSQPFPVQALTWLHFWFQAVYTGSGSTLTFTRSVTFYDALGTVVGSSGGAEAPFTGGIGNAPSTVGIRTQVPAAAVSARVSISWPLGAGGSVIVGRISARSGLANGAPLGAYVPANWVNIVGSTATIETEQGNTLNGVEDELTPGTLVARVQDVALDPATATTLRRGRPVRVTALVAGVRESVWEGTLETADVDYTDVKGDESVGTITITATDDARALNEAPCPFGQGTGFDVQVASAARFANLPTFDGDTSPAPSTTIVARDDSSKASDWIKRACNTHGGYAWIDNQNRIRHELVTYLGATPILTMSDRYADVGALYYTAIGMNYGTRSLVNDLTVRAINTTEEDGAKDYGPYVAAASVEDNGRVAGTIEVTAGSPSALANVVLPQFANPRLFPTALKFSALEDLAKVLALTPYVAVRVKRTAPAYNEVVRVLRIRHEINAQVGGDTWLTTITPRPLETATPTAVTTPVAGSDTGPGDVIAPEPGPLASRTRSTAFNIAGSTFTTIPLDSAVTSDQITWDNTNSRYVIAKDGRYIVSAGVRFAGNAVGSRALQIMVNGLVRAISVVPVTAVAAGPTATKVIKLVAGDVVSLQGWQNATTAPASLATDASTGTFMDIAYLGQ